LGRAPSVNNPERLRGGTLVVYMSNQFANFVTPFCRRLKRTHGIKAVLICTRKSDLPRADLFDFDVTAFDEVVEIGDAMEPRQAGSLPAPAELAQWAQRVETELGVSLLDIIRTDRHLGIGFVSGGSFMRSRYANGLGYPQTVDLAGRLCQFFADLLDKQRPFAVISGYGAAHIAALTSVASVRGIPMRWPIFSRTGKKMFWTENRFNWPAGLRAAYERRLAQTDVQPVEEVRLDTPYVAQLIQSTNRTNLGLRSLVHRLFKILRLEISDRLRGRTFRYGSYLFRDRVWLMCERWWWRRRAIQQKPVMSGLPDRLPYVFFPLHIEPEVAIMSEAQASDQQMTFIEWLAKTVPGGWYVVVKEHPNATTPRPRGFRERLRTIPNVIVAAPLENGENLAYAAQAVAVINGTLGVQAAIAGKPVITFHRHFQGLMMPHVLFADSYDTTRAAIQSIARGEVTPVLERRRAGAAFKAALDDCAFSVGNPGLLVGRAGDTKLQSDEVELFATRFLATFDAIGSAQHSSAA